MIPTHDLSRWADPMETNVPGPAPRKTMWHVEMSFYEGIHQAVREFLGFGRDYPPECIDDDIIEAIVTVRQNCQSWREAGIMIRNAMSFKERAIARAGLMNLYRLKKKYGDYPWKIDH